MKSEMNVIDFSSHKRQVNHELCRQCPHDVTCSEVCIAVEVLVQLCKTKNPLSQLGNIQNLRDQLDLANSFDKING